MLICIDESGSINNKNPKQPYFVIALVRVKGKATLKGKYDRFVNQYRNRLKELDIEGEMFSGDKFKELKGHCLDFEMKHNFVNFFKNTESYEVYYLKYYNSRLSDSFCKNKERAFNYPLKKAISYFMSKELLPLEDCRLNLDNRNLKTDSRMHLDEYMNTDLIGELNYTGNVVVEYFDSKDNKCVQIADVFSNLFYNSLFTNEFDDDINELICLGRIKRIFEFPLH